ncbi:MAG: OpgC domain-containing protein [Candidatus Saccharibacteria bacterium]|nr:OpgC domain-containing protein [Candidatus Saccharibacteria bacterium]
MKEVNTPPKKRRIFELDLLRGLFVVIIIIDHLQLWPSPLRYITGEGRLWVTAAEGFFLISGLLIGYIRGFKSRHKPLKEVSTLLAKRAAMLYAWGVGITFAVLLFTHLHGWHDALPDLPTKEQMASVLSVGWAVTSTEYFSPWIYFLRLYAIMLLITPLFLWLLRRKKDYIIIGLMAAAYWLSAYVYEAALQWQLLFFGAALIGYRLEAIVAWLQRHPYVRTAAIAGLLAATAITMYASYFFTHGWHKVEDPNWNVVSFDEYLAVRQVIAPYVTIDPLTLTRIALSFVWFGGLLVAFRLLRPVVLRLFGWLLLPLGQRSLSAYCLQALLLPMVVVTIAPKVDMPWVNAVVALVVVLIIWGLLRIPLVQKIIPQ